MRIHYTRLQFLQPIILPCKGMEKKRLGREKEKRKEKKLFQQQQQKKKQNKSKAKTKSQIITQTLLVVSNLKKSF